MSIFKPLLFDELVAAVNILKKSDGERATGERTGSPSINASLSDGGTGAACAPLGCWRMRSQRHRLIDHGLRGLMHLQSRGDLFPTAITVLAIGVWTGLVGVVMSIKWPQASPS